MVLLAAYMMAMYYSSYAKATTTLLISLLAPMLPHARQYNSGK